MFGRVFTAAAAIGFAMAQPAGARDVALLIGNAAYENDPALVSPVSDVSVIASRLDVMGYEVTVERDLGLDAFVDALDAFEVTATGAETALVYFAGHGMEIEGTNYLIPVDATLARESRARYEAIDLSVVREALSGAQRLRVVIVDACRDNRFLGGARGARGFAPVADGAGEVVVFSTRPGDVAEDTVAGLGLSPFAAALDEALAAAPDQDVRILFTSLAARVHELAGREQTPMAVIGQMPPGHVALASAGATPRSGEAATQSSSIEALIGQGDVDAIRRTAHALYQAGEGTADEQIDAARLYRAACSAGDPGSCDELGQMYRLGHGGLAVDPQEAVRLFALSCDRGGAGGCSNLGVAYANGLGGLTRDMTEAVRLFRASCEGGAAGGCRNLGVAYEIGQAGLTVDRAEAVRLYRMALALEPDYPEVQADLARLGARP